MNYSTNAEQSTLSAAHEYEAAGWKLVPIQWGEKRPRLKGWQLERNAAPIPDEWQGSIGLLHAWSGTCCIDIDDLERAKEWLFFEHGIDLQALLDAEDAVQIVSGRDNRAKLLYRLPSKMVKTFVAVDGQQIIDFRCFTRKGTSVQDVLPPSAHPSGSQYAWGGKGDWRHLPELPEALRAVWEALIDAHGDSRGDDADDQPTETTATDFDAVEALNAIDPDLDYDSWIRVGMAFHAAGGEFEQWDEWSSRGSKYASSSDAMDHWSSFEKRGGIGIGTLVHFAREAGWTPPPRPRPSIDEMFAGVEADEVVDMVATELPWHVQLDRVRDKLILGPRGGVKPFMANAEIALELGAGTLYPRLQFNELTKRNELVMDGKVVPAADHLINGIRANLQRHFEVNFGKADVFDAVDKLAKKNTYNPVSQWLDSLQWDSTERLDNWLVRLANAEDTPYTQRVGRYLLMSLVERARFPGCKQDYTVVFEGDQGQRKTEFVRALSPNPDWHSSVILDPRAIEETALHAAGSWVVEIGELVGLNKSDEDRIKAFMTEREDNLRIRYRAHAEKFPRTFCFVGTTNDSDWLNLLSGARRFLPVGCHGLDVEGLVAEREQLFAEAAFEIMFQGAFQACSDLEQLAAPEQAVRRREHVWEADLDKTLAQLEGDGRRAIASAELFSMVLGTLQPTMGMQRQMAGAMRHRQQWARPENGNVFPDGGAYAGHKVKGWVWVDMFKGVDP